eukprot:9673934-Lingulodinium_polyedra.AAC.2
MKCSSRPREKMSALHLGCALLRYTSGAIQNNVPPNGLALRDSTRARPKSKSLGRALSPCPSTRTLMLLRSPCTMHGRRECRYNNALHKPTHTWSLAQGAGN